MHPVLVHLGGVAVSSHAVFVGLGILAALAVFAWRVHGRGAWDDRLWIVLALTLAGGALGMRASGLVRHLDPSRNPSLADGFRYGAKSILGGLTGAYAGALLGKRIARYPFRTGDLFAPAVALGMAIGRVGCLLAEPPGRPTGLPWGVHAPATLAQCAGCAAGVAMHPSFAYEIAFHLAAFAWLVRLPRDAYAPGETLTRYLMAYAVFRFAVEFTRANETVWLGLTRPQWFLVPALAFVVWRLRPRVTRPALEAA